MSACAYGGCGKDVPDHIAAKGGRFCSSNCRAADHRERGKSIPCRVTSCGRTSDGAAYAVIRVPADFLPRLGPVHPGADIELIAGD